MPTKPPPNTVPFYLDLDEDIAGQMAALAVANRRTLREEWEHAALRHLASPPSAGAVKVPRMADAGSVAPKERKRGRPRKAKAEGDAP